MDGMRRFFLTAATLSIYIAAPASAADVTAPLSFETAAQRAAQDASNRYYRQWKISLAPVVASQTLDVASSYGMRELNPVLAGPDGRFGPRAAGIKLGATAGLLGVEYLLVRKFPGSARVFSKINWTVSALTTGFAIHNFSIR